MMPSLECTFENVTQSITLLLLMLSDVNWGVIILGHSDVSQKLISPLPKGASCLKENQENQ